MPAKIFTTMGGACPFGRKAEVDSPGCRACQYFYRTGTGTFFWCRHPDEKENAPKENPERAPEKRKRGRPAKKAISKPVNARKKKK